MKTKVIMVRHGETQWNAAGRFLGSKDIPLNEKGKRQVGCTYEILKHTHLDCIYSSPLKRAYETAEIIRGDRNINIQTDVELREINCGKWEGLNGGEVERIYPGQIELWNTKPDELVIDGGDTYKEVYDRVVQAFFRIVHENRGGTILLTFHMICIALLMLHFESKPINDIWNEKPIGNAALNIVEVSEDDIVKIIVRGDDGFMPEAEKKGSTLVAGSNK